MRPDCDCTINRASAGGTGAGARPARTGHAAKPAAGRHESSVSILSTYDIGECLHDGDESSVHRARRRADGLRVVLKLSKGAAASSRQLTRFRNEYDLLSTLACDGVVTTLGLVKHGGQLALVLEDLGGESLKQALLRGRLSLEQCLDLGRRLAEILGRVHAASVIHKDVNPHNVVYDRETGACTLIDFDIATRLRTETSRFGSATALEGTLHYIAPEQTGRMSRTLDQRADLYSLGVALYEMFTGVLPHDGADPLEIVHFHIAGRVTPPQAVDPLIPQGVSDIVLKLLAKAPEDRYQSAAGVAADLACCLEQLRADGRIRAFPLATADVVSRFDPPQKLYGRDPEVRALLQSFERVAAGSVETVLVSGHGGIGKTALVQEIYEPVTRRRGYFAAGKFDQLRRDIPFSGLVGALEDLVQQLLTEGEAELEHWRRAIQAAVAPNGRLLTDVVPTLELIIGPQPAVAELDTVESQHRFNNVFQAFAKLLCTKGCPSDAHAPLVLFLDDMQWADAASLHLVTLLLTSPATESLLLIQAYRDAEVEPGHPFALALAEQRAAGTRTEKIELGPLTIDRVAMFVADATREDVAAALPLAQTVARKTGGNPFFMRQFLQALHDEKLIVFDAHARAFRYSIAAIESATITENVAELLARKIAGMPEFTRSVLALAAAVGNDFDLDTLSIICNSGAGDVAAALEPAVRDGLIAPASVLVSLDPGELNAPLGYEHYRFLHDRVQQAAYATIPEDRRPALHLSIGRVLLVNAAAGAVESRIFDVVHHMNHGIGLIADAGERLQLATLNLKAGVKAKNSTAYTLAVQYLRNALQLLGSERWSEHYELSYDLHTKLALSLALAADFESALDVVEAALANARSRTDLAKLYTVKTGICVGRGDMAGALASTRPAAEIVGIPVPESAERVKVRLDEETALIFQRTSEVAIESLLDLPVTTDPDQLAVMSALAQCLPAAFQLNQRLFALIGCKLVTLSFRHGNSPMSARGYGAFAVALSGTHGRYRDAYRFGKLGVDLTYRLDDLSMRSGAYFAWAAFGSAWNEPVAESIDLFKQGVKYGIQAGDHAHVGSNAARCITHMQFAGLPLPDVEEQALEYERLLRRIGDATNLGVVEPRIRLIRCLRGAFDGTPDGNGDGGAAWLDGIQAGGGRSTLADWHTVRLVHRSLTGDYAGALAIAEELRPLLRYSAGFITVVEANFHASLAATALYAGADPQTRAAYDALLAENQARMKEWVDACPANFAAHYQLVEAERARLRGAKLDAMELYDAAIAAARGSGFVHVEGLACERAAEHWTREGKPDFAGLYVERALQAYEIWGAAFKVRQLAEKGVRRAAAPASTTRTTRTTRTMRAGTVTTSGAQALDVGAVVKASQAISGEIVLERLLAKLLEIIVETAGAQGGSVILATEGRLLVQASMHPVTGAVAVLEGVPLGRAERLCEGIVNYVVRSRKHVVLDDASERSRFRNDAYVRAARPKSVLCAPILHQNALTGALYLENNLVAGAFTPDRLEALSILLSQIAVSIENATLYARQEQQARAIESANVVLTKEIANRKRAEEELSRYRDHLEDLVVERTRELREAQGRLVDLSRRAGMAEVASGVLHNVGNVMNSVNVGASVAREAIRDLQIDGVAKVAELLAGQGEGLAQFLASDPRGRRVPEYLAKLGRALEEKRAGILGNIEYMMEHLEHMKRIVSAQQTHARNPGVEESCQLADLAESALAISESGLRGARIQVERDFEDLPPVLVDRHQVLQILVNLVSNAMHALAEAGGEERILRVGIHAEGEQHVRIDVEDNGIGIAADVLTKIFTHGFTTRRSGHGFGLHNSANAAQQMRGRLTAHSAGPGCGARFALQLPARYELEQQEARHA
jgi:predicted ATPase/serine/threonine protein kinase/signal transduction histidine kinase